MGRPLVISFRLERYAEPLNPAWIAGLVELDAGNAYPGEIALSHKPGKQVKMSIRTTNGRRVQNTFDLLQIAGFRLPAPASAAMAALAGGPEPSAPPTVAAALPPRGHTQPRSAAPTTPNGGRNNLAVTNAFNVIVNRQVPLIPLATGQLDPKTIIKPANPNQTDE